MPIKGLTDQPATFPQIGILRKGAPRPESGKAPGKDLTYFRFDSKDARAIEDFTAAYADENGVLEPRQVNVIFPFATVEENFLTSKESYAASGLRSRCDGEIVSAIRLPSGQMQRQFAAPVPCPGQDFCKDCKNVGRLKVIIPELRRFAYVIAETHGIWDIVHLDRQLKAFYQAFGRLTGIPFVLSRVPEKISTPRGNGDRARSEKWLLNIGIHPDWAAAQLEAQRIHQLASANIYQIGGAIDLQSVPALPQRQIRQLPAKTANMDYRQSDEWRDFEVAISACIRSANLISLEENVTQAYNLIHQGIWPKQAGVAIDRAAEGAREAIEQLQVTPTISQSQPSKTGQLAAKALKEAATKVGLDWESAKEVLRIHYPGKSPAQLKEAGELEGAIELLLSASQPVKSPKPPSENLQQEPVPF